MKKKKEGWKWKKIYIDNTFVPKMILNEIFINKNLSNWSEIKYNIKHKRKIIYNVLIKKDFQKYIDINLKKWKKVSIILILSHEFLISNYNWITLLAYQ